jgi:transmembrane protein 231
MLLTILVPFFFSFYTNGFYLKVATYFEMPEVSFTKDFIIEVVEDSSGTVTDKQFTSVSDFHHYNVNTLAPPFFSYYREDEKDDGHPEKIVFDITVQGVTSKNVRDLYLALSFNYKLDGVIKEQMISLAVFQVHSPSGLGKVNAYGTLALKQREPIEDDYQEKTEYNINPLLKVINGSLTEMYTEYLERTEITEFNGKTVVSPYGATNKFDIHIELMIPKQQEIQYNPAVLESLKNAWIQYIFVLIPLYYILIRYVLRFILSNQIIEVHIKDNLPKPKDKRWWRMFTELEPKK